MFLKMPDKKRNSLKRNKILKSKKDIDTLFTNAQSLSSYPVRVVFLINSEDNSPFKTSFSVSKRKFKKAVDRNKIKRLLREAFRLQQDNISSIDGLKMMWMYTGQEIPDFSTVYKATEKLLKEINQNYGHS